MNPDMRLGITVVDFQHEQILNLLTELQTGRPVKPSRIIKAVNDYTSKHFQTEEEIMAAHGYPELDAHRQQHEFFRRKIADLIEAMGQDELCRTRSIGDFLASWLGQHISLVDKPMAQFIAKPSLEQ